jgi:hypothetical protein
MDLSLDQSNYLSRETNHFSRVSFHLSHMKETHDNNTIHNFKMSDVTFYLSHVSSDLSPETYYYLSPETNQMSHMTNKMSLKLRPAFQFDL